MEGNPVEVSGHPGGAAEEREGILAGKMGRRLPLCRPSGIGNWASPSQSRCHPPLPPSAGRGGQGRASHTPNSRPRPGSRPRPTPDHAPLRTIHQAAGHALFWATPLAPGHSHSGPRPRLQAKLVAQLCSSLASTTATCDKRKPSLTQMHAFPRSARVLGTRSP